MKKAMSAILLVMMVLGSLTNVLALETKILKITKLE